MRKIFDISVTITNSIPVWPGDPSVKLERVSKIEDGANANVSQLACRSIPALIWMRLIIFFRMDTPSKQCHWKF